MRLFVVAAILFLLLISSKAQQQEQNLVDRLLRPNMDLRNNVQSKKFVTKTISIESRGTVGTFYLRSKTDEPRFNDTRTVLARQYSPPSFEPSPHAKFAIQNREAGASEKVSTSSVTGIHPAYDSTKAIATSSFAGERQFRGEGKSQKALDRQNPALTIEQVRELLNKNK